MHRAKRFYSDGLGWPIHEDQGEFVSSVRPTARLRWPSTVDALANDAGVAAKAAQPAPWGGYIGYFTDPDGYLWRVVGSDAGQMAYSE